MVSKTGEHFSSLGWAEVTLASPLRNASFSRDLLPHYTALGDGTHSKYMHQYEGSETEVRDLREQLKSNQAALRHLRGELETYKENDARQAALLRTLKDRVRQRQEPSESVASIKTQANCSIHSLQGENQELRDRVSELEERLRLHLREREQSEQRAVGAERRLTSCIETLARGLKVDPDGQRDPLDYLTNRACQMFQECLLWEAKVATLEEALASQELEFKASRQTLMKLASEAGKAQDVAASFNEDMKAVRKERDEALLLKAAAEQESQLLRERLEDSQRALGTACQAQAHNEKQVSELDDNLRTSAYQTRAAKALHQSFIEQLATLLSDGFTTVPATEEAVKSKVKEISESDHARTAVVGKFEDDTNTGGVVESDEGYPGLQQDLDELRKWTKKRQTEFNSDKCKVFHLEVTRLEEEIRKLSGQLESRSKLCREVTDRARRAEERLSHREEALGHLEGQLAAETLLKGGRQFERQRHAKFLRGLAQAMKVEQDVWTDDLEGQAEKLLARARELVEVELEGTDGSKEMVQSLRQKVTSQGEKLASSKRHIQLLTSRLGQLEGGAPRGHGERDATLAEMQQTVERLQGELELVKRRNRSLRDKGEDITALKAKNKEQSRTIQRLSESLEKLEAIKEKAARKVVTLASELGQAEQGAWERDARAQSLQDALTNELRSTRRALEEVAHRERQVGARGSQGHETGPSAQPGRADQDARLSEKMSNRHMSGEQMSSDQISSGQMSSEQTSSGQVSSEEVSSEEVCSGQVSSEEVSSEKMCVVLQLVDFRDTVSRALGFDTNTLAVPDDKIYLQLRSITQPHSRAAPQAQSPLHGPADGFGGRVGSWPSCSPPPSWGQSAAPPSSPPRSLGWHGLVAPPHRTP
ncbi:coiled-coil domain-containing protein 170-like [Pristis pectinata]|uniref:coiled-coil domain-containing protein 170-like n=1 Tax=Pristis pectinata TaxID=685728 RepID=UPI00223DBE63|nr:coiled-coil domain-containing protein 170-like [Pristis pectinata]